jgi:glycosyltransferase involved in cell wall biosynthesis
MRVSVVIPCYNSQRWLPETLDAVLAQTFTDFEVVLVDDGGSDDLAGWADQVGDPRVRVVRQENSGVAAARNLGIAEARGELVAFCDSDDVWDHRMLELMVARYDGEPQVGLVYTHYDVIDATGNPTGRVEAYDFEGEVWADFVLVNPVAMSASMVPKRVFDHLGGFLVNRDRFPIDVEDWELWIRIADRYPVAVVPEVLCHYRRHDSNSSNNTDSLDTAYRNLLQEVFEDQTPGRREMMGPATAGVEITLGWHSLNDDLDPNRALAYRRSAVRHQPSRRADLVYWRLGLGAYSLKYGGISAYNVVRSGFGAVRRARS